MAALIPGLAVKVEGTYNDQSQLVAKSVSFKGNDLEQAEKIEAGMHETRMQAEQNKAELEKHKAELEKHDVALQAREVPGAPSSSSSRATPHPPVTCP